MMRAKNQSSRRNNGTKLASRLIVCFLFASITLKLEAQSWKSIADQIGQGVAEEVKQHPLDPDVTLFYYTDAKLGRYWDPELKKVIGTVDLFFWSQARGSAVWGVPLGGLGVESVYVLRFAPVRRTNGVIEWSLIPQTFGARDHRWGAVAFENLKDGFEAARQSKDGWAKAIEKNRSALLGAANKALSDSNLTQLIPVPLPPPTCDEFVDGLFDRLRPEFPNHFRSPLAKIDLRNGEPLWAVAIIFAEDRAIHCFRHLQGTDSFQGKVKDWFEGAMNVPGEWVAAIYLPPPTKGTPREIQDLAQFHVNNQKDWNDKICDLIILPGDVYEGSSLYLYDAGVGDRNWHGGDLEQHPTDWRLLTLAQGYYTVRTEFAKSKNGRPYRMGSDAISSIWLNWPPH